MNTKLLEEHARLSRELEGSIKIREKFNLPFTGVLSVQRVKPSGVIMSDKKNHIVRFLIDGVYHSSCTLPEFREVEVG